MSPMKILRKRHAPQPGFRVTVSRQTNQANMEQHQHAFYEVVWIMEGTGVHVTGNFSHRIGAGDVLVLDPQRSHGYDQTDGLHLINLLLDPSLLPEWQRSFGHLPGFQRLFVLAGDQWDREGYTNRLRISEGDMEVVADWINRMEEETHSSSAEAPVLAEGWALQIIGLLSRRGADPLAERPSRSNPAGINRLFSWIELHLEEPIRVEDLAEEAGMTVRTLQRRFQERVGESPLSYVATRRMAKAKRLLRNQSELSIAEVGEACGYGDPRHFAAAFRKQTGGTPRVYRERRGGQFSPRTER